MVRQLLLVCFLIGTWVAIGAAVLLCARSLVVPVRVRFLDKHVAGLRRNVIGFVSSRRFPAVSGSNMPFLIGGGVGMCVAAVSTWGSPAFMSSLGIGACAGALGGWLVYSNIRETRRLRLLREVAILYEAVDFFTLVGYTIPQALRLGSIATPSLRAHVERCLARYSRDRVRALEEFAREVNLPEAALLSSVLVHAEEAGMSMSRSALQEESRSLEELRRSLSELRVVSKPIYFAVYRGLPLIAVSSLLVGPLAYRLVVMLKMFSTLQ